MADVEIGASVKAKRLKFKSKPEAEVEIHGEGDTRSERENLPEEVEPGVEYRDVRVRWGAAADVRTEVREDLREGPREQRRTRR
jgi:hypothetical protein